MRRLLVILVLVIGVGCASTPYRKNQGRSGGYQDQRIDETTFAVKFYGNHSNDLKTRNNLLLRCAVLARENGFAYFNAVGPINGNSNEMEVVIRPTNDKGLASYDAAVVLERYANLVNCGTTKRPEIYSSSLPGLGKACQAGLASRYDLVDSNIARP